MNKAPTLRLLSLALLAVFASCGGGGKAVRSDVILGTSEGSLPDRWAFHTLGGGDGLLACTAEFERSPDLVKGVNMPKAHRVLPVLLTVELVGDGVPVTISPESMQPVLFLENGTALAAAEPDTIRARLKKERRSDFDKMPGRSVILQKAGNSRSRHASYVFFALPERATLRGDRLSVEGVSGEAYTVDLSRSMIQIDYTAGAGSGDVTQTISIGLQ